MADVRQPLRLMLAAVLPGVAACSFFAPSYVEFANPGSSGTGGTGDLGGGDGGSVNTRNDPTDAPVLFDVYLSNDGNFSTPTKVGLQRAAVTTIDFGSAQLARYVYMVLRGSKGCCWWSIDEVNAYR